MMRSMVAGAVALVFLSGCGSVKTDEPKAEPTLNGSATAFVDMTHEEIPLTKGLPDEALIEQGQSVCEALAPHAPVTTDELGHFILGFTDGMDGLFTTEQAAVFVGYSIGAFCNDYLAN